MAPRRRGLVNALDGGDHRAVIRWLALGALLATAAHADPWADRWTSFLGSAELPEVMAQYRVLDALDGIEDREAGCAKFGASLRRARDAQPFSPALQLAMVRCAAGESARTEALALLGAQRAFLLRDGQGKSVLRPVLVATESDAAALVEGAGWTPLYGRYKVGAPGGSLPFVAIYLDERGVERQLYFDFLRVWQRLDRGQRDARFPAYLDALSAQFLRGADGTRNPAAELANISARLGDGKLELMDASVAIERLALDGHPPAAFEMLPLCLVAQDTACLKSARALVGPLAERGLSEAHLVLALALDVEGDQRAASKHIDRAARRLGQAQADLAYAQLAFSLGERGRTPLARKRLERAALAGQADAAFLQAQLAKPNRQRSWLERAAHAGSPAAAAQLALNAWRAKNAKQAREWMKLAADAGDPAGLALMALVAEVGSNRVPPNLDRAYRYFLRAADAGNAGAMRRLGRAFARGELDRRIDVVEAEGWYLSASVRGNQTAALALGELYLDEHEGLRGKAQDGLRIIEELASGGLVAAKLRLASFLIERNSDGDAERGLKLLGALAEEGQAAASFRLGQIAEFGQAGQEVDASVARAHYRRAATAGHAAARDYLARALYDGRGGPKDRAAALRWWRQAADAGWRPAANSLAWVQCSSRDPAVRDLQAGTRRISDVLGVDRNANYQDTLAACLAASGLLDQAIETQREAIANASDDADISDAQRRAFAQRLALYESGEAWAED